MADKSTDETYPKREGVADSLTPSTEIEEAEVYNVPECPEPILESDTQEVKEKRAACVNFSKHFHLKTGQKIVVVDSEDEVLNEKDVKTKYCVLGSRDHFRLITDMFTIDAITYAQVLALKSKVKELANKAQEAEAEKEAALKRCENVGQQLDTLVSEYIALTWRAIRNLRMAISCELQQLDSADGTDSSEQITLLTRFIYMINPKTIHATIHTFGHIRKLEIIPWNSAAFLRSGKRKIFNKLSALTYTSLLSTADEDEHQYDRLIRRPKTRQYFKGMAYHTEHSHCIFLAQTHRWLILFSLGDTLHRGAEERRTSYTELFWDLIFVGAIGLMGHELVHKPDGFHLEQFVLTFIPLYKVWNDVHFYLNVWASEDLVQKFFILWAQLHMDMQFPRAVSFIQVHSTGYVNDEGVVVSTFNQFVGT
ncbi:hypothetical protein BC938DRAFT_480490 [Jimgerdemannia flammicorona]|uniref:Uncharacterized protein n=1 Tax=Jimgerdemannia flammicorona TaxID=994334 RepID=A0A433QXI9_9FUNG|nr:hypothetical protein BC938DRAFT_480490 [Jimgerdemannia flammicorona]